MLRTRTSLAGALLCAAALTVAACGSDDDAATATDPPTTTVAATTTTEPPPTTTDAPATTGGPATTAPPATVDPVPPASTTTTPGVTNGFDPACTETPADGTPIDTSWDAELAAFGPLGVTPGITVNLPLGRTEGAAGATAAWVERVPGGFLFSITPDSQAFAGAMLAVVNTDGTIRWVRCFDDRMWQPIVADAAAQPTSALVGNVDLGVTGVALSSWDVISLADGTTSASLADVVADAGLPDVAEVEWMFGRSDRTLLFAPDDGHVVDEATDRLLSVDLATMEVSTVKFPPGSDGREVFRIGVDGWNGERIFVTERAVDMPDPVAAVLMDGEWSTDPADLAEARPVYVDFPFEQDATIWAADAAGAILWERDDIGTHGGEGFRLAIDGDVVVVAGCAPSGDTLDPCSDEGGLFGLDAATGETLWQLDGPRGVGPIGDGYAIVTDEFDPDDPQPSNWLMIETATGEPVEGQEWPAPLTFGTECCGAGETAHTDLLGGAVAAVHGTQAFIWFPAALTPRIPPVVAIP